MRTRPLLVIASLLAVATGSAISAQITSNPLPLLSKSVGWRWKSETSRACRIRAACAPPIRTWRSPDLHA